MSGRCAPFQVDAPLAPRLSPRVGSLLRTPCRLRFALPLTSRDSTLAPRPRPWPALALACFLLAWLPGATCAPRPDTKGAFFAERLPAEPRVRVRLSLAPVGITVSTTGRAQLNALSAAGNPPPSSPGRALATLKSGDTLRISASASSLVVGGRDTGTRRAVLRAEKGALQVHGTWSGKPQDRRYHGELEVLADGGGLVVVNRVGLEDYVAGVVGYEMPLSWRDAALFAQAVAARSYAMWEMKAAIEGGKNTDLYDDTRSQVYRGIDARADGKAARVVAKTAGLVLAWTPPGTDRPRLFKTFFHSTCGGKTVSASQVFGGAEEKPLSGTTCGFCTASPRYRWRKEVPRDAAMALTKKAPGHQGRVTSISVTYPNGRDFSPVVEVRTTGASAPLALDPGEVRAALGLNSAFFDVRTEGKMFVFKGRGWGHGVGMCQWGARGAAKAGLDFLGILGKYYPGSEVYRVYDTGREKSSTGR